MAIIYIVDFPISGNSGKNKATREKAKALEQIVGSAQFHFFHLPSTGKGTDKVIARFLLDFKVLGNCLLMKGKHTVIQRVFFLPFSRLYFAIRGWKVYSEFHADFHEEIPLLNKNRFQKFILRMISPLYNFNYKLSHGIIYNHPYLKNKFDPIFNRPSIYSYNGANIDDYLPGDKEEARYGLSIPSDITIFLFLGSVSRWHGVDYLVDIFNAEILVERDDIFLYVVGASNSKYVDELKEKVTSKRIIFVSPVDNHIANAYINAADYCLLPVKEVRSSPGSPLKFYDYISCGKPVIAQKDVAGYSDEVENYKLGFTIDYRDPRTAARELLSIADSNSTDLYAANRLIAANNLNWVNRMRNWLNFIEERS